MSDTANIGQTIQSTLNREIETVLKYSLLGRTIDVEGFIARFRAGASTHAGQDGTLGAKYSAIGDRFCVPNLRDVTLRINHDPTITDLRWAAYMLATTYWETAHVVDSGIRRKHGHGDYRVTETFLPVSESGGGGEREYSKPVRFFPAPVGMRSSPPAVGMCSLLMAPPVPSSAPAGLPSCRNTRIQRRRPGMERLRSAPEACRALITVAAMFS